MKTSRRGLMTGLFGTGFCLMASLIWAEIPATAQPVLRCQMARVPMPGANQMDDHADAKLSQGGVVDDEAIVIATVAGPIELGPNLLRLLFAPAAKSEVVGKTLAARIKALSPDRRIYLVVRGLSAVKQPGVFFNLYFNLPPNTPPQKNDPHYIGAINFFNAVKYGRSKAPGPNNPAFFSFDVTAILQDLQARRLLSDQATVTIDPVGAPSGAAKPMIGQVVLVEQ
ncbi:MAG: hypothetical protein V7641_1221 [Blastocatellia bacterium]